MIITFSMNPSLFPWFKGYFPETLLIFPKSFQGRYQVFVVEWFFSGVASYLYDISQSADFATMLQCKRLSAALVFIGSIVGGVIASFAPANFCA